MMVRTSSTFSVEFCTSPSFLWGAMTFWSGYRSENEKLPSLFTPQWLNTASITHLKQMNHSLLKSPRKASKRGPKGRIRTHFVWESKTTIFP
jgi:hypothetical protein